MIVPFLFVISPNSNLDGVGSALDELAASNGLVAGTRMQPHGLPGRVFEYRSGPDVYLSVDACNGLRSDDLRSTKEGWQRGAAGISPQCNPSEVPLGQFCFVFSDGGLIRVGGCGTTIEARLSVRNPGRNRARYNRLLEAAARIAFAESAGEDVLVDQARPVSGSKTKSDAPMTYRSIASSWHRNNSNPLGDRLDMKKGLSTVILTLGSDEAVVNGKRFPLGGFVLRKKGVWIVPDSKAAQSLKIL